MDNWSFILLIWLFVFLLSGITESNNGIYDYPAPNWLKKVGNPFSGQKKTLLSMALLRVVNNILVILSFVGCSFRTSMENYWKIAGAKYVVIIIFTCCISIAIEQIFVIFKKNKKNIGGNIYMICFFMLGSVFMAYMYYKFIILPTL